LCVGGYDGEENFNNILFDCVMFLKVWCVILKWLGASCALSNITVHFHKFCDLYVLHVKPKEHFIVI
jgi:hypothetical protein